MHRAKSQYFYISLSWSFTGTHTLGKWLFLHLFPQFGPYFALTAPSAPPPYGDENCVNSTPRQVQSHVFVPCIVCVTSTQKLKPCCQWKLCGISPLRSPHFLFPYSDFHFLLSEESTCASLLQPPTYVYVSDRLTGGPTVPHTPDPTSVTHSMSA